MIAKFIAWLNEGMGVVFGLFDPVLKALPPWLSLTILSALLGVVLLVLFKYTSPQTAIGRVRDRIKSNLLAMKLFKDNIPVVLKSQVKVFIAAVMLLVYSIPPMLVMILPFCLVLGQLGVWYQARPLDVNERAIVTMQLSAAEDRPMPLVSLAPSDAIRVVAGPVRVPTKQQVYWQIEAMQPGRHLLEFDVGRASPNLRGARDPNADEHAATPLQRGEPRPTQDASIQHPDTIRVQKELVAGSGFMPVSMKRPSLNIGDLILYPAEKPFGADSPVQSINIGYPDRTGPITGSGNWVVSLFIISMLGAFAAKPFFNVKI